MKSRKSCKGCNGSLTKQLNGSYSCDICGASYVNPVDIKVRCADDYEIAAKVYVSDDLIDKAAQFDSIAISLEDQIVDIISQIVRDQLQYEIVPSSHYDAVEIIRGHLTLSLKDPNTIENNDLHSVICRWINEHKEVTK